ncbi:hypothetical protein [Rhodoplanes roseus]|uniref:hypothetical protein n=1 Tax=Rhodoplanes roseus TaxID=29409 RepID=UPI0011B4455A|nr:hypothetical protein [Rhodoplanes roseus]
MDRTMLPPGNIRLYADTMCQHRSSKALSQMTVYIRDLFLPVRKTNRTMPSPSVAVFWTTTNIGSPHLSDERRFDIFQVSAMKFLRLLSDVTFICGMPL